ncbi:hypothetical protein PLANPX_5063 [Lacipirellula parvula]|uniref:Uncharacterized protein n=1 Tax=Lacipirellula parvula TaxID=2650471 RepID=A0A5K7XK08_9BACT|nr:hypothetical protein PLANPX_5063 [Lacipirellula parvula]
MPLRCRFVRQFKIFFGPNRSYPQPARGEPQRRSRRDIDDIKHRQSSSYASPPA